MVNMSCGDGIDGIDEEYLVNIRRVALLRFDDVCYNAWATDKVSCEPAVTVEWHLLCAIRGPGGIAQ